MSNRAELRVGTSLSGGPRLECTRCGKVAYATEEIATEAADRIRAADGGDLGSRFSRLCGWYHLSRNEEARDNR